VETIKRQTRAAYGWFVASLSVGAGCTQAQSVTWTAPLLLR